MRRALWVIVGAFGFLAIGAQAASAAEPVLSPADATVAEDVASGQAVVALRLDRAATRRISAGWKTVAGSATKADYVVDSGTVTFRAGDKVRKVAISLRDDALDEGTERFFVVIDAPRARVRDDRAAVTITDDDPLPSLSGTVKTVLEGARGTQTPAPVTVSLSRVSGRRVTFKWAVATGTATAGADVKGADTRSIPAGTKTVTVPAAVVGDNVAEGNEAAPVKLTSPVNARVAKHGTVKVTDDDDPETSTDLQLSLATARAESDSFTATMDDGISLQGDVIEATGADGTLYRLTVPDGALPYPVTITMTPWKDVEGISATGGSFAGVDLKPSGLEFLKPARLEIIPPGGAAVDAISFAYSNNGREAHRYPLIPDPTKLEFVVSHFSGVGTYLGDLLSIPVEPAPPTDPGQALAAEIERVTGEERRRVLDGEAPDDTVMPYVIELLRNYFTYVVEPLLPNIREDCDFAKANQATALRWAHQAAVLSESSFPAELADIIDAIGDAAENCLNEAMEPCVDRQDMDQINEMNFWRRRMALMGRPEPDPHPNDPIRDCKDVLLGSLVVQYDRSWKTGTEQEFHHEEHYTTTFNPRLVSPSPGYWIDDGRGGWSMTGSYDFDDTRANNCLDYVDTYSGGGIFRTTMIDNETQLNPDQHDGLANFHIENFVPQWPTGDPTLRAEYVFDVAREAYLSNNGTCEPNDSTRNAWKSVPPCPAAGGGVVGSRKTDNSKQGVEFNCTKTVNLEHETLSLTITGTFWLGKG